MIAPSPPAWVASYVGLPYREGGRSRDGCDCWGLAVLVYAEQLGRALAAHDGLSAASVAGAAMAIEGEQQSGSWFQVQVARAYDLAICSTAVRCGIGRRIADLHLGVVAAPGWLLHTESEAAGAVCVRLEALGRRVREFWRHV